MDYKPYSKMMNFVLTYKCINRECNIETITHQDIDLKKYCEKCNDKHPKFILKTYHDSFKKGLEDWDNSRGLNLTKTCSYDQCNYLEKRSYSLKSLVMSKSCLRCGMLSALTSFKLGSIYFKLTEPIKYVSFECEKCKNNWKTTCYWWGYKQGCDKCKKKYFPLDISIDFYNTTQPVKFKIPKYKDIEKNHNVKICERCEQTGKPCYDLSKDLIQEITDKREDERNKILGIKPEEKKKEEEKKGAKEKDKGGKEKEKDKDIDKDKEKKK